jgi:hypothetical protein
VPLVVLIVVMGVAPRPFLDRMHGAVDDLIAHVETRTQVERRAAAPVEIPADAAVAAAAGGGR